MGKVSVKKISGEDIGRRYREKIAGENSGRRIMGRCLADRGKGRVEVAIFIGWRSGWEISRSVGRGFLVSRLIELFWFELIFILIGVSYCKNKNNRLEFVASGLSG